MDVYYNCSVYVLGHVLGFLVRGSNRTDDEIPIALEICEHDDIDRMAIIISSTESGSLANLPR
jgi:hypothetical protein